jgi:hypothetical protein
VEGLILKNGALLRFATGKGVGELGPDSVSPVREGSREELSGGAVGFDFGDRRGGSPRGQQISDSGPELGVLRGGDWGAVDEGLDAINDVRAVGDHTEGTPAGSDAEGHENGL